MKSFRIFLNEAAILHEGALSHAKTYLLTQQLLSKQPNKNGAIVTSTGFAKDPEIGEIPDTLTIYPGHHPAYTEQLKDPEFFRRYSADPELKKDIDYTGTHPHWRAPLVFPGAAPSTSFSAGETVLGSQDPGVAGHEIRHAQHGTRANFSQHMKDLHRHDPKFQELIGAYRIDPSQRNLDDVRQYVTRQSSVQPENAKRLSAPQFLNKVPMDTHFQKFHSTFGKYLPKINFLQNRPDMRWEYALSTHERDAQQQGDVAFHMENLKKMSDHLNSTDYEKRQAGLQGLHDSITRTGNREDWDRAVKSFTETKDPTHLKTMAQIARNSIIKSTLSAPYPEGLDRAHITYIGTTTDHVVKGIKQDTTLLPQQQDKLVKQASEFLQGHLEQDRQERNKQTEAALHMLATHHLGIESAVLGAIASHSLNDEHKKTINNQIKQYRKSQNPDLNFDTN